MTIVFITIQTIYCKYLHNILDYVDYVKVQRVKLMKRHVLYISNLCENEVISYEIRNEFGLVEMTMKTSLTAFYIIKRTWATYVITGWRFTLIALRYQIYMHFTLGIVTLRSWYYGGKPLLAVLLFPIATSSHSFHNAIFSWINGRFSG